MQPPLAAFVHPKLPLAARLGHCWGARPSRWPFPASRRKPPGARIVPIRSAPPDQPALKSLQPSPVMPTRCELRQLALRRLRALRATKNSTVLCPVRPPQTAFGSLRTATMQTATFTGVRPSPGAATWQNRPASDWRMRVAVWTLLRPGTAALRPRSSPQTAIGRCLRTATNWDFAGEHARPGGRFRRAKNRSPIGMVPPERGLSQSAARRQTNPL